MRSPGPRADRQFSVSSMPMGFRRFSIRRLSTLLFVLALVIGVGMFAQYQNNHLVVEHFAVDTDRIGAFRIVHLSDLHGKQFGFQNEELYQAVVETEPDLVVFTGDMIHFTANNRDDVVAFLARLNQTAPVVCIPGNHEWRSHVREEFFAQLRATGVVVLENEIFTAHFGDKTVHILGLDERYSDGARGETTRTLLGELAGHDGLRIVLSHYPQYFALLDEDSYRLFDFDLMFAGHAHGGQWRIPGFGALYAHGQGVCPPYVSGMYEGRLVVSPGLGNSAFPLRLFNYPQINVIDINGAIGSDTPDQP